VEQRALLSAGYAGSAGAAAAGRKYGSVAGGGGGAPARFDEANSLGYGSITEALGGGGVGVQGVGAGSVSGGAQAGDERRLAMSYGGVSGGGGGAQARFEGSLHAVVGAGGLQGIPGVSSSGGREGFGLANSSGPEGFGGFAGSGVSTSVGEGFGLAGMGGDRRRTLDSMLYAPSSDKSHGTYVI